MDISSIGLGLLAIMALVFANGFFVAAEFALVTVRKTRIDQLIAEGHRGARTVRRAITDPDSYIAATQLGITMASLGLGWIGEPALASLIEPVFHAVGDRLGPIGVDQPWVAAVSAHTVAVVISFSIITALHIVLGELAPKTVALQQAETVSLLVARPTELFMKGFWPFITFLNGLGNLVVRSMGFRPPTGHALVHSEEELKMLVTASQEAGVLEEEEEQMLHRVFAFSDLTAGQIMVPRTEMAAVELETPIAQVAEIAARGGYARLPVYRRHIDDIAGTVHVADLLQILARGETLPDLGPVVRDAFAVPETMTADALLAEMRERGSGVAIVIDEFGGTAGMVTFAGLMERIVGGVSPGGGPARITVLADGSALIDGLALVADVNEQFGLHIDEETYNTIGGYALGRLGRRARVGDRIEIEGRTLRVEALDGLRVARVYLSLVRPAEPEPQAHA
jgi:CBS domain containing-hemolysin-like protein